MDHQIDLKLPPYNVGFIEELVALSKLAFDDIDAGYITWRISNMPYFSAFDSDPQNFPPLQILVGSKPSWQEIIPNIPAYEEFERSIYASKTSVRRQCVKIRQTNYEIKYEDERASEWAVFLRCCDVFHHQ